jgi:sporulation protein YlmC with PRC-barrel domain
MKKLALSLITLAAAVAFAVPLFAAGEYKTPKELEMESPEMKTTAYKGTANKLTGTDLIGLPVFNDKGEKIGSITDIMIDPDIGRINYVSVTKEDGTEASVPLYAFEINSMEMKAVMLPGKEEKMATAPMETEGQTTEDYFYELQGHYGIYPAWQIVPKKKQEGIKQGTGSMK